MEVQAYKSMGLQEDSHWYYQARLWVISQLIKKYVLESSARLRIVDVGCGTGRSVVALSQFGDVVGVEPSSVALEILREKFPEIDVRQGTVEGIMAAVGGQSHDLVTALGVLCHREVLDPSSAVGQIANVLSPRGWFLWNDCIYPQLRREHDELVHCGRRFYPHEMHEILRKNGFEVIHSSNLLAWGSPIAFALSLVYRLRKRFSRNSREMKLHSDDRPVPGILNEVLKGLTVAEWRLAECGVRFPVGVSRMILARKLG